MMKTITWGDSFKWSGIVLGLYAAVIGAIAAYEKWIAYKDKAERLDKYNSSGPVQCGCRRLELHQDRYRHILFAELLLQNYGAGCRQNRPAEHTLQEPVLLSSEEQGGN